MSKYRICIIHNRLRQVVGEVCVAACIIAALCSLPQYLWFWLSFKTTLLSVAATLTLVIGKSLYDAFSNNISATQYALSITSDGIIRAVSDSVPSSDSSNMEAPSFLADATADGTSMKIHQSSQLFTWGLCINVLRHKRRWFEKDYSHLTWVLKGECCEADYRRLARAIVFARKATP